MSTLGKEDFGGSDGAEKTETKVSYTGEHPLIWGRSSTLPLDIAQELSQVFALVRIVHQLSINRHETDSQFAADAEEARDAAAALLRERTNEFETKFNMV